MKRAALLVGILALAGCAVAPEYGDQCTAAEYAYYEARGWDSLECDGDKAHAPDAGLTFPQLTAED